MILTDILGCFSNGARRRSDASSLYFVLLGYRGADQPTPFRCDLDSGNQYRMLLTLLFSCSKQPLIPPQYYLSQDEWLAWKEGEEGAWGSFLVADIWTLPTFVVSKLPIKTIRISVTMGGVQWLVLECPMRTPVMAGPALFLGLRKSAVWTMSVWTLSG